MEHDANGTAVHTFLGVPFAAPPVGDGRFAAPGPHAGWAEPRAATHVGPCCPQGSAHDSEDCLTLDMYVPAAGGGAGGGGGQAIMAWFYGAPRSLRTRLRPRLSAEC